MYNQQLFKAAHPILSARALEGEIAFTKCSILQSSSSSHWPALTVPQENTPASTHRAQSWLSPGYRMPCRASVSPSPTGGLAAPHKPRGALPEGSPHGCARVPQTHKSFIILTSDLETGVGLPCHHHRFRPAPSNGDA